MPEPVMLRGARVVDPATGRDGEADVLVADGRIEAVGAGLDPRGAEVVECSGLVLAPGLVDLHTHLREPGFEHKETIETGTRAAAVGGFTAVSSMANTDPVTDHAGIVAEVRDKAERRGARRRVPRRRHHEGPGRRVDGRDGRDGRGGRPGVQRRRQVRADRPDAAQRARVREGVPGRDRHRRALRGRLARRGRPHARRGARRPRWVSRGGPPRPRRSSSPATSRSPGRPVGASTSATSRAPARSS